MLCPECNFSNPEGSTVCANCQTPFPQSSPEEGSEDLTEGPTVLMEQPQSEESEPLVGTEETASADLVEVPTVSDVVLTDVAEMPTLSPASLSQTSADSDEEATDALPVASVAPSEPVAPAAPPQRSWLKVALVILLIVLLLGGGSGVAAAVLSANRPQPVIRLSSVYTQGTTPVGAVGTTFQVSGQNFPAKEKITFLLDGATVPGSSSLLSNSQGSVSGTLAVTAAWSAGNHVLTARSASSSTAVKGLPLLIVAAGRDKTPGPNGAPTDSAGGTVAATLGESANGTSSSTFSGGNIFENIMTFEGLTYRGTESMNLTVTGEPNGGTVCRRGDDGKVHTYNHPASQPSTVTTTPNSGFELLSPDDLDYTETFAATCSGTYRGGHLTYTEMYSHFTLKYTIAVIAAPGNLPPGVQLPSSITTSCSIQNTFPVLHMDGTFSDSIDLSGTYSLSGYTLHCNDMIPANQHVTASTGSWTGTSTLSDPTAPHASTNTSGPTASTCFINPSAPRVPAVYAGNTAPTTGPATAPPVSGVPVTLADGLRYLDIKAGTGPAVQTHSTISANYTGWLASTCQKFDSSYDPFAGAITNEQNTPVAAGPFTVQLGRGEVIKGWDEGLLGMRAGGIRRLYIPAALAYGSQPEGAIPANSDLIFDITLLSVK